MDHGQGVHDQLVVSIDFLPGCLTGAHVDPEDAAVILSCVGISWNPGSFEASLSAGATHDGHLVGEPAGRRIVSGWTRLSSGDATVRVAWVGGHTFASVTADAPAAARAHVERLITAAAGCEPIELPDCATRVALPGGSAAHVTVDLGHVDEVHDAARFAAALLSGRGMIVTPRVRLVQAA